MPREEVPYPCDCGECNTSQKLKTINGIEPNDGGNISILGDEGVTVKTDKDNHIVTFGIDTSTIDNVRHADSATKATYDANGKTIMNTDGTQNVTGAKTFVGDQVFTGAISASGAITATGAINASNTANVLKAANHDSVLTSNDVLTAKDINEVNGSANNLLHRSGDESVSGTKLISGAIAYPADTSTNRQSVVIRKFGDASNNTTGVLISNSTAKAVINIHADLNTPWISIGTTTIPAYAYPANTATGNEIVTAAWVIAKIKKMMS